MKALFLGLAYNFTFISLTKDMIMADYVDTTQYTLKVYTVSEYEKFVFSM